MNFWSFPLLNQPFRGIYSGHQKKLPPPLENCWFFCTYKFSLHIMYRTWPLKIKKTWRNLSNQYIEQEQVIHMNIKITVCLYNLYNMYKVHVVWLCFLKKILVQYIGLRDFFMSYNIKMQMKYFHGQEHIIFLISIPYQNKEADQDTYEVFTTN